MRKIVVMFLLIGVIALAGCGASKMELKLGTYKSGTDDCTIVLGEDNMLTISGYDFSDIEKHIYEDSVIALENSKRSENEFLTSEEEQKIRDKIDMRKQFSVANKFSIQEESNQGCIGIYVPVEGCDLFFYVQYFPNDNTLVFEDRIFNLTEN